MYQLKALVVCLCIAVAAATAVQQDDGRQGRIAGGMDAEPGQFPYQVSLRTLMNIHFCGGAILNHRWIVTAGSCPKGKEASDILAMVGSKSLTRGGTNHVIDRIVLHPNFNEFTLENDVAVLRVRAPIQLNNDAMAVQMATSYVSIAYGALVSGWGRKAMDNPTFPDWLQYIPVTIISNTECRARFQAPYNERIVDSTVCTSSPIGQGACLGDAGGPLLHGGQLQGIMSWGIPCGLGSPDVFARITDHRGWILVHTMV